LELEWGVLRIERRDPVQGVLLRAWLEERVLLAFSEQMLYRLCLLGLGQAQGAGHPNRTYRLPSEIWLAR